MQVVGVTVGGGSNWAEGPHAALCSAADGREGCHQAQARIRTRSGCRQRIRRRPQRLDADID